jgi:ADP-ribose pyrophosphatase YjhB (NUDIX family)
MGREYPQAPVAGVGAVVLREGRVLLVRRGREPLRGRWSLPGGVLELGETLMEGVVREVFEETGLRVVPRQIVETFDRIHRDPDGRQQYHYVLVDFLCHVECGELGSGDLISGDDAEDVCWAARADLLPGGPYQLEPFTSAVIEKAIAIAEALKS